MRKSNGLPPDRRDDRPAFDNASDPLLPGMRLDQIGQALASAYDDLVAEGVPEHLAGLVRRVNDVGFGEDGKSGRLALVVEDEPEIRALAEATLDESELSVIACESAEAALAVLQERGGDVALVFADIRLAGDMDGVQLAHAVATLWPKARLVVTSGAAVERSSEIPESAVFIPKPWRPPEVLAHAAHAAAEAPPAVA